MKCNAESKATDNICQMFLHSSAAHILLREKKNCQHHRSGGKPLGVSSRVSTTGRRQSQRGVPGTAQSCTYYFELDKQLVDVCHVSQDQQAGDSGEEGTRRPDHVPSFHRGAGVIGKLPRGSLHQATCTKKDCPTLLAWHFGQGGKDSWGS